MQRRRKHTSITIDELQCVFCAWSVTKIYREQRRSFGVSGVECLHRGPASCRRRRRGKFRIWDGEVWSGSRGTRSRDWLRWRGLAAVVGGGPVFSSEGAPRDSLTVVEVWSWSPRDSTRPVHACVATNTNTKSGGTVGGGVLYSVGIEFMRQGIADWPSRVWRRVGITSTVALRVVKGTQCLAVQLGHPLPGGYKYGDLAPKVGWVSNLRQ
jgi:hypothetical protein